MPYLQFDSVSKGFPGVQALKAVTFGVSAGSVHGLMGENGAGKSTLLKILAGVYQPDTGSVQLGGNARRFASTTDALAAGVAVIYQELHLVPELTVAENLYLGHVPQRGGWVNQTQLRKQTIDLLEMLGEPLDPGAKVSSLAIGQRQMVEIAKALSREASVIAFDEPTSSLSARETDRLFAVIGKLRQAGKAILYVSHRMDEIYQICDAATVLRDGQHVETFETLKGVERDTLVRRMVGRSIADIFQYRTRPIGDVVLEVQKMLGPGLSEPASFGVSKGEIVGFFGLIGAGRSELMKLIYGATPAKSGRLLLDGKPVTIKSPRDAVRSGIVLCPEDRKKEGIIPLASVMDNVNLSCRRHFSPMGFINMRRERANASTQVKAMAVKTPGLGQEIRNLSGGNQQKVILGRWLSEDGVRVILLDEPTRGIDVGAKSEIYSIIYKLAESGCAVVVISSELPEVLGICDRVIVMREGKISGTLSRAQSTQERALALALPVQTAPVQTSPIQTAPVQTSPIQKLSNL